MTMVSAPHDEIYLPRPPATGGVRPVGGPLKRTLDVAVALVALVLLAPLLAVVAILVVATMGAPALCRQPRIGFGGRTIDCHRFRTTRMDSDEPTRLGNILVESGIAKLPQLLNVLKGEMSCVGPRPLLVGETELSATEGIACLQARPGITGEWRLARGVTGGDASAPLDITYVDNWSMRNDIGILFKSLSAAGRSED
jgi:exopolysaccharide production protein ExoY